MSERKSFLMYFAEMVEQYHADRQRDLPQQAQTQPSRLRRLLRWLMPNGGTLLLIAILLLTQNVWARPTASPVAAPGPSATTVNYQGRLANPSGTPLDGTYGMSFSLWDAPSGGNLVWGPESHVAVPVSEGLFSVGLGSQTSGGIPTNTWNGDRYLEITVGGETLSPRELIRSVPIAGMALTVPDGAIRNRNVALDIFDARIGADVEITQDDQEMVSLAVNSPVNACYLVFATFTSYRTAEGRTWAYLRDENGGGIAPWFINSHDRGGIGSTQTTNYSDVWCTSAGNHVIRMLAVDSGSSGTGWVRGGSGIVAVPFAQAP